MRAAAPIALALAAVLAACADRPRGVLRPTPVDALGTSRVEMLVATTRAPSNDPATLFSGERGARLAFADIAISIPPASARTIGDVQWPASLPGDPSREFVTVRAAEIDVATTRRLFAERIRASGHGGRVLLFVHGYNTRFEDAVMRFAQIAQDSGAPAVPVLFTWPSRGQLLAYTYDRESATYSRDALEAVIDEIDRHPGVREISVLSHSMGNWVTIEALRQSAIRRGRLPGKLRDVMLAAPDLDVDVFARQMAAIGPHRPRFTLFASRDDQALGLSRRIWGDVPRLGAIDATVEPYRSLLDANRITLVDLTSLAARDSIAHEKFAQSPDVVRFIGRRLVEGQTLTDNAGSLGDRLVAGASDVGSFVGGVVGGIVAAPAAILGAGVR